MADYKTKITVGRRVVSFPMDGARSVHLRKHTLLRLIPSLRTKTKRRVEGQIIKGKEIIFNV